MSTPPTVALMTTEEMLALPDDGKERWLIRGELREKPMTVRNRSHSRVLARIAQLLGNWLDSQPEPRGEILGGEAGVRLRRTPDSTIGVDLAYVSAEMAGEEPEYTTLIDGVPVLAVEILSPSDTVEEIGEKVDEYLHAGVALVWLVDPHERSVKVRQPNARPRLFSEDEELSGEPHLPGFRVAVRQLFSR